MTINPVFALGQTVYLDTDPEQLPRMVVGYIIRPESSIIYSLASGTRETDHQEVEISEEKNVTF